MNELETYYNKFSEEKRLDSRHGQVEFRVSMKYIVNCIEQLRREKTGAVLKILDIGAGTGRYSVPLSEMGHDVTAVELVKYNLGMLKLKGSRVHPILGNALNLKKLADDSFDLTLLFGPMYHLFSQEDRLRALQEAKRVTRPGGYILIAYVMNEYSVITYGFKERHVLECMEQGRFTEDFHTVSRPEHLYDYVRIEDIRALSEAADLKEELLLSPDGAANYIRPFLNQLSEEEFERFVEYQMSVCERQDLVGAGAHTVQILRK